MADLYGLDMLRMVRTAGVAMFVLIGFMSVLPVKYKFQAGERLTSKYKFLYGISIPEGDL